MNKVYLGKNGGLPVGRTKGFAFCNSFVWYALIVCRLGIDCVAPPLPNGVLADRAVLGVFQSKEDDHETDAITCVQTTRQNI